MHSTKLVFTLLALLLLFSTPGCAPRIPPEELGEVMKELPALPGTDQPYPLPELEPPSSVEAAKP